MKFENMKKIAAAQFRRVTGVKQKTFYKMVEIVARADKKKKAQNEVIDAIQNTIKELKNN